MPVAVRFTETLEGAYRLTGSPREGRMRLALEGASRAIQVWRGEPVAVAGTVVAADFLPETPVQGTLAFDRRSVAFTYRFATVSTPEPVYVFHGLRTMRGDAYAGLTTLSLVIHLAAQRIGNATLRLDARGGPRTIAGMRVSWA